MSLETKTEFGSAHQMITADDDFTLPQNGEVLKVDLACGQIKREGYKGLDVDVNLGSNVDIFHDLMKFPWPFEESSVFEFNCEHYVEHIPHQIFIPKSPFLGEAEAHMLEKDGLILFMEEAYRCLIAGGLIRIIAPYYTSVRAWQDPTHVRAINEVTFNYFNKEAAEKAFVDHYTGKCNFKVVSQRLHVTDEWQGKSEEALAWAQKHYWNVVSDIEVTLRAIK
jgi:hypothetical protein